MKNKTPFKTHTKKNYCSEVVRRVVAVVRKLTNRGLALRGSNGIAGFTHSGNSLMAMEFPSGFDTSTKEHSGKFGDKGKGVTKYLSSRPYEKVVSIKAQMCRETVCNNLRAASIIR